MGWASRALLAAVSDMRRRALSRVSRCHTLYYSAIRGSNMPTISLRIDAELGERLERLANETRRTKSFLAVEAIREYVELQEWQILGIRDAMAQADAGELVDHEQVESWLKTWGTRDEQEPPK